MNKTSHVLFLFSCFSNLTPCLKLFKPVNIKTCLYIIDFCIFTFPSSLPRRYVVSVFESYIMLLGSKLDPFESLLPLPRSTLAGRVSLIGTRCGLTNAGLPVNLAGKISTDMTQWRILYNSLRPNSCVNFLKKSKFPFVINLSLTCTQI